MSARAEGRGVIGTAGNVVLTIAAIGGVVCILFVVLAVFFNVTLIMFKTGSMSPTIPTGSLAVVKLLPADDIAVGNVVTVDRPDALPVTHRVTSITRLDGGMVSITMKGDGNQTEDPAPYVVSSVRLVLFSVPGLAYAVRAVSSPLALGAITIGAAALVTWAFWPRDAARPRTPKPPRGPAHGRAGRRHARAASLAVLLVAAAGGAALLPSAPASAAVTEEVITGRVITLTSIGDRAAMLRMIPGTPVDWQVGVGALPSNQGTIGMTLLASGGLVADAAGLWLTVSSCPVRWAAGACAGGGTVLAGPGPASAIVGAGLPLGTMPAHEQRWVLVQTSLPANPAALPTGVASLSVMASGSGDTVTAGGDLGPLAHTGTDLRAPVIAALGAVAAGLLAAFLARWGPRHTAVAS